MINRRVTRKLPNAELAYVNVSNNQLEDEVSNLSFRSKREGRINVNIPYIPVWGLRSESSPTLQTYNPITKYRVFLYHGKVKSR